MDHIDNPGGITFLWMVIVLVACLVLRALYVMSRDATIARDLLTGACLCGHPRAMHEHYRDEGRPTDCGICGPTVCPKFLEVKV
jgi:hypothetical protein